MAKKAPKAKAQKTLRFRYSERLASEHFGSHRYTTAESALRELVANALDADAKGVRISLIENKIFGLESILVVDDGNGMTLSEVEDRFMEVGVAPSPGHSGNRLGRFGVGRFAVNGLGQVSDWVTMSRLGDEPRRLSFTLRSGDRRVDIAMRPSAPRDRYGTSIRIGMVRPGSLTPESIAADLAAHFCAYLLANPKRSIVVQGRKIDIKAMIESEATQSIAATHEHAAAKVRHLILKTAASIERFGGQVVYTVKGRVVTSTPAPAGTQGRYLALVESQMLDQLVTESRTDLLQMDDSFARLRACVEESVRSFAKKWREGRSAEFLNEARREPYYPYRAPPRDQVEELRQEVYDLTLEKLNERANVSSMTEAQKKIVFKLLDRALVSQDVLQVLSEVAGLSDQEMEKFRKVLERVTLESIVRMTTVVTDRLQFLDVLHQLVYGQESEFLKERSQLHKVLEPNCWIFGPQFHLATSDRGFRTVIQRHREFVSLPPASEDTLSAVGGIDQIPDLFLACEKDYPAMAPRHQRLLVELKRPKVDVGPPEVQQIRRYQQTIMKSDQWDQDSSHWTIVVLSSSIHPDVEAERSQKHLPHGCLGEWDNCRLWAFTWGEIIDRAKAELQGVRDHLKSKSEDLKLANYVRENFPHLGIRTDGGT
jgi:hypothetical protein